MTEELTMTDINQVAKAIERAEVARSETVAINTRFARMLLDDYGGVSSVQDKIDRLEEDLEAAEDRAETAEDRARHAEEELEKVEQELQGLKRKAS